MPEIPPFNVPNHVYRQRREVFFFRRNKTSPSTTVFIGLFQALPYLEQIKQTIDNQTQSNLHWLIVDNCSTDGTWEQVYEWAKNSKHSITLARNGINLGGAGTMFVNLDLVETETLTFMHQDDLYSNKFVEKMLKGLSDCPDAVVGFSDMGRISESGRPKGAFPSAAWALRDFDSASLFLANIRNHCVPWPAFIVNTAIFEQCESPWFSTAFTDTETTLKMLSFGKFVHIPIEEMRYRDNPLSESRSISTHDKEFGVSVALTRVFNSVEFLSILNSVELPNREPFVKALCEAIDFRLGESVFTNLIQALAMEQIDRHWNHLSYVAVQKLQSLYGSVGAQRSVELLCSIENYVFENLKEDSLSQVTKYKENVHLENLTIHHKEKNVRHFLIGGYSFLWKFVPYRFRRLFWKFGFAILSRVKPQNPWNYRWR